MKIKYIFFTLIIIFFCNTKLNAIEDISINNYSIVPSFSKDVKVYNVFVSSNKEIITINAVPSENEVITGSGSKSLKIGMNEIEVSSYVEEKLVDTYLLKINRGDVVFNEDDSYLKSLSVMGYDIDFEKDKLEYYIDANDNDRLYLNYETYNPKATVFVNGDITLNNESNVINVKVVSENKKSTTIYKIYAKKILEVVEEKNVKKSIFDNENFSDDELKIIRDIIILMELIIIVILFYLIVIKKRTNKILYIKRSILRK